MFVDAVVGSRQLFKVKIASASGILPLSTRGYSRNREILKIVFIKELLLLFFLQMFAELPNHTGTQMRWK